MDTTVDQASRLQGFDPLTEATDVEAVDRTVFEEATQRIVLNILKSYTGYFDVFSELIQNALDAIDLARKTEPDKPGRLWIAIDVPEGKVVVSDNGIGMDERQVRYCFRPSVSFKSRRESRGHKGVGATFLAYGFTNIHVHTKRNDSALSVQLSNGRAWAEDSSGTHSRPTLQIVPINPPELENEASGTRVEILIGGHRPDLTWWGAQTAQQWLKMLCMRTPLGGIYLAGASKPKVRVDVSVVGSAGERTEAQTERAEYLFPHEEMKEILAKIQDVTTLRIETRKVDADILRLPAEYKNLGAIWEIWDRQQLLDDTELMWDKVFEEEEQRLIRLHDVPVYGCFLSSAKSWTQYQEHVLRIRRSPPLMRGGMQIASDCMVQGDLSVIPLTSTIGYQANTHVVIHFRDGNPDMGRKVFQPEIKALAEKISRQVVNIFKRYLHLMREDTGAPTSQESSDTWHWLQDLVEFRKANALDFSVSGTPLAYVSKPQCEQDVVAIFHELVGMNMLPGIRFLSTTQTKKYDSCYVTHYDDHKFAYQRDARPLGVSQKNITSRESRPFILEYKYDFDALVADMEKDEKFLGDVNFVVCWQIGEDYKERYRVVSLLVGDEGVVRSVYGSTHALFSGGEKRLEILCLEDFIAFHQNRDGLLATHEQRFRP